MIVTLLIGYRQNCKPVSVLSCHLSSQPTPRKRTSSPFVLADAPVYMVLLVLVPSPSYVAIRRRELLPRGFILTLSGGLFSVTAFIRLLPSVLSTAGYSAQSGLSSPEGATSHSTYNLYPSLRSSLSFCALIFATAFSRPGVMSSQCLWHCIDLEYILPMQKLLCEHPLQCFSSACILFTKSVSSSTARPI